MNSLFLQTFIFLFKPVAFIYFEQFLRIVSQIRSKQNPQIGFIIGKKSHITQGYDIHAHHGLLGDILF